MKHFHKTHRWDKNSFHNSLKFLGKLAKCIKFIKFSSSNKGCLTLERAPLTTPTALLRRSLPFSMRSPMILLCSSLCSSTALSTSLSKSLVSYNQRAKLDLKIELNKSLCDWQRMSWVHCTRSITIRACQQWSCNLEPYFKKCSSKIKSKMMHCQPWKIWIHFFFLNCEP